MQKIKQEEEAKQQKIKEEEEAKKQKIKEEEAIMQKIKDDH